MSSDLKIGPYIQEVEGQSFQVKAVSNQGVGVQWIRCVVSKLVFLYIRICNKCSGVFFSFNFKNDCNLIPRPSPATSLFFPTEGTGKQWGTWAFPLIPTSLTTMNVHSHLCCFLPLVWKETLTMEFRPPNMPVLLTSAGDITKYSSVPHGPLSHSYFSGISLPTGPSLYSSSLH